MDAASPDTAESPQEGAPTQEQQPDPRRQRSHRRWRRVRSTVSVALLAAAVALIVLRAGTLERSTRKLANVDPAWVLLAVGAEAGSMLAFGRLQQRLLRAGGCNIPLSTMVAVTTASNAITSTLPGGVAWAAAWLYDQLGSRGVSRFLRVWVFLVAGGVSSFALFLVIAAGVELAGSHGPVASLRWLAFLLALIPLAALVLDAFRDRKPVSHLVHWVEEEVEHVPGGRSVLGGVRRLIARFTAIRLGPLGWLDVLFLALCNWLFDCVVVLAALEALHVRVPWDGILVIYGLTQISASVPITPGGIGIVVGSMTALMHAYGVPLPNALAVVILYRIVSFWILVPIGWGVWSVLEVTTRRRRIRHGTGITGMNIGTSSAAEPLPAPVPAPAPAPSPETPR